MSRQTDEEMVEYSTLQEVNQPANLLLGRPRPCWPSLLQAGLALSEVTNAYRCLGDTLVTLWHVLKARLQAKDLYLPLCCPRDLELEPVRPSGRRGRRVWM